MLIITTPTAIRPVGRGALVISERLNMGQSNNRKQLLQLVKIGFPRPAVNGGAGGFRVGGEGLARE
jgi:hypothetical protein